MSVDINSKDGQIIRQLIPLTTISSNKFESLCKDVTIETAKKGAFLFRRNDPTTELIYLIEGSVSLQSDQLIVERVKSGTESARFALAHQIPRKIDAFSDTAVRFLRLDIDVVKKLPSIAKIEEKSSMLTNEAEEAENDDDWMTTLLQSPIFRVLPPANLQQIIISLEEVAYEKGDKIINQGDEGDYYYLIKEGQCLLSRRPSPNAKEIKLGRLRTQDTFGEDSLLSGEPRNMSITAFTPVKLLRLTKAKFTSLIKEPSLKFIKHTDLDEELAKGSTLLDISTPDEYKKQHLPGSVNIPFFSLRMQAKTIDVTKSVIVVCEDGKLSEAAAFFFLRHNVEAFILEGGMSSAVLTKEEPISAAVVENNSMELSSLDKPEGLQLVDVDEVGVESGESDLNIVSSKLELSAEPSQEEGGGRLQAENKALKQMVNKLRAEKQALEEICQDLCKQSERLTAFLNKGRS